MILAHRNEEHIISKALAAFSAYDKAAFGEKQEQKIIYAPIEALYLVQQKKMELTNNKGKISFEQLIKLYKKKDKRISTKLIAYTDLRKKGYTVKTALKFGTDFRVYAKGIKPGQDHAPWLLTVKEEHEQTKWPELTALARVAHTTKKKVLIALVDSEHAVSYYELNWHRP